MKAPVAEQQELISIYPLCGQIDIRLKKMKNKAIFQVGLSRSGKSTVFNYANNVPLIGVAPQNTQIDQFDPLDTIDVVYEPRIVNTDIAEANNGVKSVTLLPNIVDRGDYSLVDMPGYLDKRRYNAVIGVSYAIKKAFSLVEECQFVLVIKHDCFKSGQEQELFRTFKGFLNMFNFDLLTEEVKIKILKSITFVIAKATKNQKVQAFARKIKSLLKQAQDPQYAESQNVKKMVFLMEYFADHPEQIYLFTVAELGQESPPCTLAQDHFSKRTFFQIKLQNQKFYQEKNKYVYRLPFAQDYSEMEKKDKQKTDEYQALVKAEADENKKKQIKKPLLDQARLKQEFEKRVKSFRQFARVLEKFFRKAIITKNLFDEELNFREEFEYIKEYVQKYNVYSNFDIKHQSQFKTRFSVGDSANKLKTGMRLARNVFELYKTFANLPSYNNQEDMSVLDNFMTQYKNYLIKITQLFRDSFCTKYEEQQLILQFLFIGVRGCKEFSVLFEIIPTGRHDTCQNLQDSFQAILNAKPLIKLQQQFINQLSINLSNVIQIVKSNNDEINEYVKFLKGLEEDEDAKQLIEQENFKKLKRTFLELRTSHHTTYQQKLISICENFIEHKKLVQEKIRQLEDDEGDYPDQLNFKFVNQLSNMGQIILNLTRHDNLDLDHFAYGRVDDIQGCRGNRSIQQFLIIEQAQNAMEIFKYIKDPESVLESYEVILKNIPQTDYTDKVHYYKSQAEYCLINGRVEQATVCYQKALKICMRANLGTQYKQIKEMLSRIPSEREEKMAVYFNELKLKEIIDPEYDTTFKDIVRNIKAYYIDPYQQRQEARKQNQ